MLFVSQLTEIYIINIKSKKQLVCLNRKCLSTFSKKNGKCLSCNSDMHRFDSSGESERFQYLTYTKKIKNIKLQKKFPLTIPKVYLKSTGILTDDMIFNGFNIKDYSDDLSYKADFVYDSPDPKYQGKQIIEDYKPCMMDKKTGKVKPIFHGDSYLRLRIIARLYNDYYYVVISYKYNNIYYEDVLKVK